MHNINVEEGLEIKNHFTVFQHHVVLQLIHGRSFKCDIEDLHIFEDFVWGINGGGYVTTTHFGLTISFHNAVWGSNRLDILLLIISTETLSTAANLIYIQLVNGLKVSIIELEKIIDLDPLEFIIAHAIILGLQSGLLRKETSVKNCILLESIDLKLLDN